MANSEQVLGEAKDFIDKIQKKRKEIQTSGSDDPTSEKTAGPRTNLTVPSMTPRVSQEAIDIHNKLKDQVGREPAPNRVSDSFFDIQVQQQQPTRPTNPVESVQTPVVENDPAKKHRGINRLLNRNSSETSRKNVLKNLFSRK